MRRTFSFPIKGLSVNNMFYAEKRFGLNADARIWVDTLCHLLSKPDNAKKMSELRDTFDPKTQAYAIQIKSYIPKDIYYTKDGKLSRRSFDITNVEKPLVDVLFLDKFKVGLLTDDCVLKSCHSVKLPSPDGSWSINVTIKIVSNK